MKKIEGYLDLCSILNLPEGKQSYEYELAIVEKLSQNPEVEMLKFEPGLNMLFSFWYGEEKYFFSYDSLTDPVAELIVGCIADDLKVGHIEYDMAKIGNIKGTLSKYYIVKDFKYLSGRDILVGNVDYALDEDLIDAYGYEEAKLREISRYNALEGIWHGLEYRYENRLDVVEELMNGFIDMFIVDVLTGQRDRHFDNWNIVEYPDGRVELMPLFDNGRSFTVHPLMCRMGLSVNDLNENAPIKLLEKNLEDFVKQSSREFISRLVDSLWVLLPENVEKIFERIESKIGFPLSDKDKQDYRVKIGIQLEFLMSRLNVTSVKMPKRIKL